MARKQSWNAVGQHRELLAADEAINPLLDTAKITSIKVAGVDKPASETPLELRIKAYADVAKTGASNTDSIELATLNGQITAQLEKEQGEHALARSSVATLTQDNSRLAADLATASASVNKLTADNAELGSRNSSLAKNLETSAGQINSQKLSLARKCLAVGCVEFKGKDGKALSANAADADLTAAAKDIAFDSMVDSYAGALNSAMTKLGLPLASLPGQPATGTTEPPKPGAGLTGIERAQAVHKANQAKAAK